MAFSDKNVIVALQRNRAKFIEKRMLHFVRFARQISSILTKNECEKMHLFKSSLYQNLFSFHSKATSLESLQPQNTNQANFLRSFFCVFCFVV